MITTDTPPLDLVIIGGGPAGMSAALIAGRALLDATIVNAESPRNAVTTASHGFLTRDDVHPTELVAIAKQQLATYGTVRYLNDTVVSTRQTAKGFEVVLGDGFEHRGERLALFGGESAAHYAPMIRMWTDDLMVFAESLGVTSSSTDWGTTALDVGDTGGTNIGGLYVVGDAKTGFSGVVGAAAEGAACAESIVHEIAVERWSPTLAVSVPATPPRSA